MLRGKTNNILADNWHQLEINHIDYEQQDIIHEESSLVSIYFFNKLHHFKKIQPTMHCTALHRVNSKWIIFQLIPIVSKGVVGFFPSMIVNRIMKQGYPTFGE